MKRFDTTNTKGKIKVMQAAEMGSPLQRRLRDAAAQWRDTEVSDDWDWINFDYRITPRPAEFCLCIRPDGQPAWLPWNESLRGTGIHVREVLPQ